MTNVMTLLFQQSTPLSSVAIFQCMEFTFHSLSVILELLSGTVIFWSELTQTRFCLSFDLRILITHLVSSSSSVSIKSVLSLSKVLCCQRFFPCSKQFFTIQETKATINMMVVKKGEKYEDSFLVVQVTLLTYWPLNWETLLQDNKQKMFQISLVSY